MNKRYKELLEIVTKFPFLKDTVQSNIREVYTDAEFLNYKYFIKDYDYNADLFVLSNKTPKFYRGSYYSYSYDNKIPFKNKEDILLYNLIAASDTSSVYTSVKNYPVLVEICNVLIDHLNINESELTTKHFDTYQYDNSELTEDDKVKRDMVKTVGYLADTFAFGDTFTEYIRSTNEDGKSNLIADIMASGPVSAQLNKLCTVLNLHARNIYHEYYVAGKSNIHNLINTAVAKVYDSYSLEDIETFKTKAAAVSNIFNYFNVDIVREASLLNNHISDEDRNELTKNFTSANDIAELTKNVINAFKNEAMFDGEKINLIISNVIVGNKKIRDRDFPDSKDKVVHEFFRLLFISSSSSRDFTKDEQYKNEINKVIDSNLDYVLDPYFVTACLLKESVITNYYTDMVKNTKSFMDNVFTTSDRVIKFIDKYIKELQKPQSERKSTVKGVKADIISYGTLYYILSEYGKTKLEYNGLEEDGTINPTKLLLLAYGKHHDDVKKHLLEDSGNRDSSSYGYYSSDNSSNMSKIIAAILSPKRGDYTKQLIGNDGVDRCVTVLEQKFHGNFNNIMSYLLEEDDDFDYNENLSIGVREGSRWSSRRDKVSVPKKYYNYIRESIKLVLIQLYKHIVEDYGAVLTQEHLDELKAFITRKDNTINIVPDTVFAVATQDKNSSLNREYASDVTEYGCLNYISLSSFCIFLLSYRDNSSLFNFNINEDLVLLPELDIKYYENRSRGTVGNRAKKMIDLFNSLNDEELSFYKPMLHDNFADEFAFTRTMQVCLFANMLNAQDSVSYQYGSYKDYLVDSYTLQSDVARSGAPRPIDFVQVFFVNVLYPRLLEKNLITADEIHTVEDSFNRAYTDYDCLLSLR